MCPLSCRSAAVVFALLFATGCATRQPPLIEPAAPLVETNLTPAPEAADMESDAGPAADGPANAPLVTQVGLASWYGHPFHGRITASGARFDMRQPVAAHPTFPFGTRVRITNLVNGRQAIITIVDRGPARRHQRAGVIIDVSHGVAQRLGFVRDGIRRVRVEVIEWGNSGGS